MTSEPIKYLSVSGVAEHLGLSINTITGYRTKGMLPPYDALIGTTGGWLPETIDTWQANRPGKGGRPRPATEG